MKCMLLHTHLTDEETEVRVLSDLPKLAIGGGFSLSSWGLAFSGRLLRQTGECGEDGNGRSGAVRAGIRTWKALGEE